MRKIILISIFLFIYCVINLIYAQEKLGIGIGILPTGTETGVCFRTSKQNRFLVDLRISKANIFFHSNSGSMINEASFLYRVSLQEKLRFHIGLGARSEWNFDKKIMHRHGIISSFGVEAFPFPFQNGGLFFEIAPYYTSDKNHLQNLAIRSTSGFIYYISKKQKKHEKI